MLSPYFKALARVPHICPWCHAKASLEESPKNPNVAVWRCDERCGWFEAVEAPRRARVARVIGFPKNR